MKRLLILLAISIVVICLAQLATEYMLKWNYNAASFNAGMITIIWLYIIFNIILAVKDRSKGIATANITITVKENSSTEDVEDAVVTGMKTFNLMKRLGKTVLRSEVHSEENDPDDDSDGNSNDEIVEERSDYTTDA